MRKCRCCLLRRSICSCAGWFRCDKSVKMARPKNNKELLEIISGSSKIKGAGVGHSW